MLALDGLELEIELKGFGPSMVDEVLRVVEGADRLGDVEFTSSNVSILTELRRRQPAATTGPFTPRREP